MKSISLPVLDLLRSDKLDLIDLISIRPPGGTEASTVHLCSGGENRTVGSVTYNAVNIAMGQTDDRLISQPSNTPNIDISISNINTDMATLLNRFEIEDSLVTIKQCDRRLTGERHAWIVGTGRLDNANMNSQVLGFSVINVLGDLDNLVIPKRLWQPKCGYRFGSKACGVDLLASPNTIQTTAQAGTTSAYVVLDDSVLSAASNPDDPTDYWANGYIIMVNGDLATQIRPIHRYASVGGDNRFYVRFDFLKSPAPGDALLIQRGCRHTKSDCFIRQGNRLNYGGFKEVPYGLIKPSIIGNVPEV